MAKGVARVARCPGIGAQRNEDTKYDPDYCPERDSLQKHAEAGGGEDSLRQSSLNELH